MTGVRGTLCSIKSQPSRENFVVTAVSLRLIPSKQLALRIHYRRVKRQLSIHKPGASAAETNQGKLIAVA